MHVFTQARQIGAFAYFLRAVDQRRGEAEVPRWCHYGAQVHAHGVHRAQGAFYKDVFACMSIIVELGVGYVPVGWKNNRLALLFNNLHHSILILHIIHAQIMYSSGGA